MDILNDKIVQKGQCLLWTGHKTRNGGYAFARAEGKMRNLHKYFYEKEHGEVEEGLWLVNTCGNKHCVNSKHWKTGKRGRVEKRGKYVTYSPETKAKAALLRGEGKTLRAVSIELNVPLSTINRWL